jgi:hypothetical protein
VVQVQGRSSWVTVVAVATWAALTFVALVHAVGGAPGPFGVACVLLAQPLAVAAALRAAASYWRGPDIVSFTRSDSEACTPAEAEYVHEHAQLRGTMGGAGYLYRRRLALPVIAWLAAAVAGATVVSGPIDELVGPWPVVLTSITAFVAFLLPARPYYYRDTTGGGAIVCPPPAAARLKRRAAIAAAIGRGERVIAETPPPTPAPGLAVVEPTSRDPA